MPEWKCERCGKTVEAPVEPEQCPCGSEDITEIEDETILDRVLELF